MVIESFAGYSSLGWNLCSLRVCMTSAQAYIFFGEKSSVILIGLLYMLLDFFPLLLLIFFVLCIWCFDYYVTGGISFLIQSIWNSVGFLYIYGLLFLVRDIFFYNFVEDAY